MTTPGIYDCNVAAYVNQLQHAPTTDVASYIIVMTSNTNIITQFFFTTQNGRTPEFYFRTWFYRADAEERPTVSWQKIQTTVVNV